MKKAKIFFQDKPAGFLTETDENNKYIFEYLPEYQGGPISLTIPTSQRLYEFDGFPSFFEGLLPEGPQLEALLASCGTGRGDYFGQLVLAGRELVGAVSVFAVEGEGK